MDGQRYADTKFGSVRRTGGPHGYLAYFPKPIPRQVAISEANLLRLADAEAALGRLAGAGRLLPAPHLLVRPYLRRESTTRRSKPSVNEVIDHWLAPFLDGIRTQATDAVARAERLTDLREKYRTTVQAATRGIANQVAELALEQPVLNARTVERRLTVSRPAALKALRQLADVGILTEAAGGPRGQLRWRAHEVLSVLIDE